MMNNSICTPNNGILPKYMTTNFIKGSMVLDNNETEAGKLIIIYNAFTGIKITTTFTSSNNMEAFKSFISQSLDIETDRLFLLTSFGVKLKFSMILHEQINEIFVFDRKFFNPNLIKHDKSNLIIKDLLLNINNDEINTDIIKPRESPNLNIINNFKFQEFIEKLKNLTEKSESDENIIINSADLDFDNLRNFLNLIKRNSGWSNALFSDLKNFILNNNYFKDYEIIENILKSLNSLIQYILNLLKNLDNDFNSILEMFNNLNNNSLSQKWEESFKLLENIKFSFIDKRTVELKTLILSELIDLKKVEKSSKNSRIQSTRINRYFIELKELIKSEILIQKDLMLEDFNIYKKLYLKLNFNESEKENLDKSNEIFQKLQVYNNKINNDINKLPTFEELITTSNQMSTFLSKDAISKICRLLEIYNLQINDYIPKITELSSELYQIQSKFFKLRGELQLKILNSTLISIVKIQLSIRDANKLLNEDIFNNIEKLQSNELQLKLIIELPMIFGIYIISNLNNLKYSKSIIKLGLKTNEILEMLNFIERNNRNKWINEFIENFGTTKNNLVFLNNENFKKKFIYENLPHFKIVEERGKESDVQPVIEQPIRKNLDTLGYFNKFIQNINNSKKTTKVVELEKDHQEIEVIDNNSNSTIDFFNGLIENLTIQDIEKYVNNLKELKYDSKLLNELLTFLKNLGINGTHNEDIGNELRVKGGNLENLGSFDHLDQHYMKIFEKFIKSYDTKDIKIEIHENKKVENVNNDSGLINIYKERIKKLENLLHEKKFELFNEQWGDEMNEEEYRGIDIKLPPSHYFAKIRMFEKENGELRKDIDALKKDKTVEEVERLNKIIEQQNDDIQLFKVRDDEYKKYIDYQDSVIEKLNAELKDKDEQLLRVNKENEEMDRNVIELNSMNKDLLENMKHLEVEYLNENKINQKENNDLKLKIEELVELNKQYVKFSDVMKEMKELIKRLVEVILYLTSKLTELNELVVNNLRTFCLILEIMGLLIIKDGEKVDIQRVKGLRLKKKGTLKEGEDVEDDKIFMKIIASDIIDDVMRHVKWIPNLEHVEEGFDKFKIKEIDGGDDGNSDDGEDEGVGEDGESENNDSTGEYKIKEIESTLESLKNYDEMVHYVIEECDEEQVERKYTQFIKSIVGVEEARILEGVHKRFEDVESLARKLQREKVQLRGEMGQQVALKNFSVGSLVLFLKTLGEPAAGAAEGAAEGADGATGEASEASAKEQQPWAVFNIGAPHYYLRLGAADDERAQRLRGREWFVGKVRALEKKVVRAGDADNVRANPFNLPVGTVWWWVDSEKERW